MVEPLQADDWRTNCFSSVVFCFIKNNLTSQPSAPPRDCNGQHLNTLMLKICVHLLTISMEMADTVEVILQFLKEHSFTKTERALRDELGAMNAVEELPRLPPVRLQLGGNTNLESSRDENSTRSFDSAIFLSTANTPEGFFGLGSFLDVPVGQDVSSAGMTHPCGRPSASEGMLEDASDRLSGFATAGDGEGESALDYPCQHWDSDTYEDDDDPGYRRQPVEDQAWFLAHEIDHPTEDDRARDADIDNGGNLGVDLGKLDGDIKHVMEEESSSFGDGYSGLRDAELRNSEKESIQPSLDDQTILNGNIVCSREGELTDSGNRQYGYSLEVTNSLLGPTRSYGTLVNGNAAVSGNKCVAGESSEVFIENSGGGVPENQETMHDRFWQNLSFHEDSGARAIDQLESNDAAVRPVEDDYEEQDMHLLYYSNELVNKRQSLKLQFSKQDSQEHGPGCAVRNQSCKSDELSSSSSIRSKESLDLGLFEHSNLSSQSTNDYLCMEAKDEGDADQDMSKLSGCQDLVAAEDEEMAALQDEAHRIGSEEDEYEVFDLKIIHRKNRTGFEEEKDLSVVINSVIAGRYHVTEYLGSAAFSKAIQAHDLHTGMDVCMKIIKNNKDFFDQSLDEIKLLKYVNKHDPADQYHILRLYDYFYHREHLFIVCELLRANLYEFQKFNKESGGEVYFTMPRLQSIARQCLEALEFLHGLGLIHCDLKPENILVKSYSRCEVKVIDLGSSCFQTDHLCTYVQSRSYRAPEVILGLPYDQKIDIWSLGCILAELCSGNVLFQNDSLATLLARMIGILGPIDPEMLAKGCDTHKYFTKNHVLYERIQETEQLEYILPKKTSLSHRLPLGDQGFVEFVAYLLQINPLHRPTATEALMHPWLSFPYEPISA